MYDIFRYIECPLIILFSVKNNRRIGRNRSVWFLLITLFFFYLAGITFYYGRVANALVAVRNAVFSICFIIAIDYYSEIDFKKAIRSIRLSFEVLFWIHFVTVILFPKGLYLVSNDANPGFVNMGYFLGHENNSIEIFIPLIGLLMIEKYLDRRQLGFHTLLLIICSLITVIISWSANAIVCLVMFLLFYILFNKPIIRFFNLRSFLGVSVGMTLLFPVLRMEYAFSWFITTVLKKSMTLSKRTFIWTKSIAYIKNNWVLGYGIESTYEKVAKIGAINSCHNYFLDVLYYGGVLLLIVYVAMIIYHSRTIRSIHNKHLFLICSVITGVYSILWIATPIHRGTICIMFGVWLLMSKIPEHLNANMAS